MNERTYETQTGEVGVPVWLAADVAAAQETERAESIRIFRFLILFPYNDLKKIRNSYDLISQIVECLALREHRAMLESHIQNLEEDLEVEDTAARLRVNLVQQYGRIRPIALDRAQLHRPAVMIDAEFVEAHILKLVVHSGLVDVGSMLIGEALDEGRSREQSIAAVRVRAAVLEGRKAGVEELPMLADGRAPRLYLPDDRHINTAMAKVPSAPGMRFCQDEDFINHGAKIANAEWPIQRRQMLREAKQQVAERAFAIRLKDPKFALAERIRNEPNIWSAVERLLFRGYNLSVEDAWRIGRDLLVQAEKAAPDPDPSEELMSYLSRQPDSASYCAKWIMRFRLERLLAFDLNSDPNGERFCYLLSRFNKAEAHHGASVRFANWYAEFSEVFDQAATVWSARISEAQKRFRR